MLPENKAHALPAYAEESGYIQAPSADQIKKGVVPLDTLPAQWWNWMWQTIFEEHSLSVTTTTAILTELQNVLKLANIVPDEATQDQLATAIKNLTLDIIGNLNDLEFAEGEETVVAALNSLYRKITEDIQKQIDTVTQDLEETKTEFGQQLNELETKVNDTIETELTQVKQDITTINETITTEIDGVTERVEKIEEKIPATASADNQLADKNFVLRHVATNTANFRGEWPDWVSVPTDGEQYPEDYSGNHNPTENDYMVVRNAQDYAEDRVEIIPEHWERKYWNVDDFKWGCLDIWHDKDGSIYYSRNDIQLQLVEGEWVAKDWGEVSPPYGDNIWYDNAGNIYYSGNSAQLQLLNGKWVTKNWDSFPSFLSGSYIWHDNEGNIYFSNGSAQYQLIGNRWETKNWESSSGEYPTGGEVWRDNESNIYCSVTSRQLQLINGKWETKEWNIRPQYGSYIWRDTKNNIYYSYEGNNYQLVNGEWITKDWGAVYPRSGKYVWHDNDGNTYFSDNPDYNWPYTQLQLVPEQKNVPYFKGAWQFKYTGDWASKGKDGWEPEFALGDTVDLEMLDERYQTLDKAAEQDKNIDSNTKRIDALEQSGGGNIQEQLESLPISFTDFNDSSYIVTRMGEKNWVRKTLSWLWNWIANSLITIFYVSSSPRCAVKMHSSGSSGDVYTQFASAGPNQPTNGLPEHIKGNTEVGFGVGSGHSNKGIYSWDNGSVGEGKSYWLIRSDSNGNAFCDAPGGFKSPNGIILPTSQPSTLVDGMIWVS